MARELQPLDIADSPEVLSLAEEVARSGISRVLRRDETDVAVISPAPQASRSAKGGRGVTSDDALWDIVGIADASQFPDVPCDVSSNVDKHLAEVNKPQP